MIVGVLTICHTQHTWDRSICIFLFNRTTLQVFVTYLTGALYVHPSWFYKHQHDNWVRSRLFVACQRWWFRWLFWFVHSVPGYLREKEEHKPDPWSPAPFPPTSQRIFKPAFTAAMDRAWDRWWSDATRLATSFSRCNPMWFLSMGLRQGSGLLVRYVTKTWSVVLLNKKIHILLSQVYCAWQVVKTPTIILNNPVFII